MAIFDVHHLWVFAFGLSGNIISIIVFLAPVPTFIKIYRNKSTLGFRSLPYVVALFSSMLWMYYAFLKPDAILLISVNSIGCVVETIYIIIYLKYANREARNHTVKLLGGLNVVLFSTILVITLFLVPGSHRALVVGWICVGFAVTVFAAPLTVVVQVVRTKSVEFMPIALSFWLTLSAVMWFGYGVCLKDLCIALPNVFGFILGMIQMVVYGLYRNAKKEDPVNEENQMQKEHVINVVILEGPEVVHQSNDEANKAMTGGQNGNRTEDEEEEFQQKMNERSRRSLEEAAVHEPCKVSVQLHDVTPVLITCVA